MTKVLIVDDDVVLRDFIQSSLTRVGYDVQTIDSHVKMVRDGFEAVVSEIERPFSLDKLKHRLRLMGVTQTARIQDTDI